MTTKARTPVSEEGGVPALVRSLVEEVGVDAHTASPLADVLELDEVMLDVEVDGFRCLLVRVPPSDPNQGSLLSPREFEIARMVAKGYPNKTIASVLDISSWTVSSHLRRIFHKLGVGSRAAMVARLLEEGLLRPKREDDAVATPARPR